MTPSTGRRALWLLVAALLTAAGLGARAGLDGAPAKYAGVALYASLVYALVAAIGPRLDPRRATAIAVGFCWVVEFAQLSDVPASMSRRSTIARLVLGSTFNAPDLFWYAVGAVAVAGLDLLGFRRRAQSMPE